MSINCNLVKMRDAARETEARARRMLDEQPAVCGDSDKTGTPHDGQIPLVRS